MEISKLTSMLSLVTFILLFSHSSSTESVGASRSVTSDLLGILMCGFQSHPVECVKERAGRILDTWEERVDGEMRSWGEEADRSISVSGRQLSEPPSLTGRKLKMALDELATLLQKSMYKSEGRKKGGGGGIDSITISTAGQDQKKKKKGDKKKKKKPAALHLHHDSDKEEDEDMDKDKDKGAVVQNPSANADKTLIQGLWVDRELVGPAKTRIKREDDSKELEDGRGKRKKKKKAILKLLLLGAVLKAKLSLLLQLFSAHLQVKFFTIALAGLAINIARFYFDMKKGHQPQKVIYYEHAQHQHHYDHDDDHGFGGYWSRSIDVKPTNRQDGITETSAVNQQADDLAFGGWTGRSAEMTRRK